MLHKPSVMSSTCQTDTPTRYYLNQSLFHTALPTAISLDDGRFEGNALEPGHFQGNIRRSGSKIEAIVTAAIALVLFIALIPGSLSQFVRLCIQQLIEGFLYAASNQFFDFPLDNFLV